MSLLPSTLSASRADRVVRAALLVVLAVALVFALQPGVARAFIEHEVQPGETLGLIADRYGIPVETLMDINRLSDPNEVQAGQKLRIPELGTPTGAAPAAPPVTIAKTHTVQPGETLSHIADEYNVALATLRAVNNLDSDVILVGQQLAIPGAAGAESPREETPGTEHIVSPNESLGTIASRYGVSIDALAKRNNLDDVNRIYVGQKLVVPGTGAAGGTGGASAPAVPSASGKVHTVAPGDTLSHIADTYGVPMARIVELNGIANANAIWTGMVLQIPAQAAAASAPQPQIFRTHIVTVGETLAGIAGLYGTSTHSLAHLNDLADANHIFVGQVLTVPGNPPRKLSLAEYGAMMEAAANEFGVPASLVKAIAWQESGWNNEMVSHAGAIGTMQIMPYTGQWALEELIHDAPDWRTNPRNNIRMGAAILAHHIIEADYDRNLAIAAYYQGFTSIREIGYYNDTREYVASVNSLIPTYQ